MLRPVFDEDGEPLPGLGRCAEAQARALSPTGGRAHGAANPLRGSASRVLRAGYVRLAPGVENGRAPSPPFGTRSSRSMSSTFTGSSHSVAPITFFTTRPF